MPVDWSSCSINDIEILTRQLGRAPRTVLAVARRCRYGAPQVIVNDPLPVEGNETPRPFPTLFWLTCPYLVREVGRLEARGWIGAIRDRMGSDELEAMAKAHEDYASLRLELCNREQAESLRERAPKQYEILAHSGVGGMLNSDGVKCLHTHLADYLGRHRQAKRRSGVNWIGQKTTELLLEAGVDLDGSSTCGGCVAQSECSKVAAIEVGSHAVRMIVSQDDQGRHVIEQRRAVTGLGEGVDLRGRLSEAPMDRTIQALTDFAQACRIHQAVPVAGATAAVRRSENGGMFLRRVWEETGLSIPILSEADEAQLSFAGTTVGTRSSELSSDQSSEQPLEQYLHIVIDVGGGSTEITLGRGSKEIISFVSFPLGAVVATERFFTNDPPQASEIDDLKAEIRGFLDSAFLNKKRIEAWHGQSLTFVAVGGTASSALAMKHGISENDIDSLKDPCLRPNDVSGLLERLKKLPLAQRVEFPGLAAERAEGIIAGLIILGEVMDEFEVATLAVSRTDILHGLLQRAFSGTR